MEKPLVARYKQTGKLAEALKKKPGIHNFAQPYIDAFFELNKRRQYGMAEQPLTVEAILRYGREFNFSCDLRFFYKAMEGMDEEFLSHRAKQREAEKSKENKGRKS